MLPPQVRYVPLVMAMGICPDDPRTFFMQQYRWCMGTAALVLSRGFWKTSGSVMQKMCLLSGMMYYIATAVVRKRFNLTTKLTLSQHLKIPPGNWCVYIMWL